MAIHYSVESLPSLFLSDEFLSEKDTYQQSHRFEIQSLHTFLDSIEINKQYFRTGIQVKNPRYKKRVSDDTLLIKQLKSSLNKMSSMNYQTLCKQIMTDVTGKPHLYPFLLQSILEQSFLHHTYCNYYAFLVKDLHTHFQNKSLIDTHMERCYQSIKQEGTSTETSEYSKLCSKNKQLDQWIGYSILVCELEKLQVIQNKVEPLIQELIQQLHTTQKEDELFKCVSCLYTVCNSVYKKNNLPEEYVVSLQNVKDTMKFMKIKFKLLDILERR